MCERLTGISSIKNLLKHYITLAVYDMIIVETIFFSLSPDYIRAFLPSRLNIGLKFAKNNKLTNFTKDELGKALSENLKKY